jgi:hypothetical protein
MEGMEGAEWTYSAGEDRRRFAVTIMR